MKQPANSYFLWDRDRCQPWNPFEELPHSHWVRTRYFGQVFRNMEEALDEEELTIYLTTSIHDLPSYGDNVIAVLQEDQPSRIPRYVDRVRATFTCHGTQQSLRPNPFLQPSYSNLLSAGIYTTNLLHRVPSKIWYTWKKLRTGALPPIYTIPLGYANQLDVPYKPLDERENDVFFAGSVDHSIRPNQIKEWLGSPKYYSRRELIERLRKIEADRPSINIDLQVQDNFRSSISASAEAYSKSMMNSKICPVPRGTTLESYRFFEAIRYGCIPIVEALPSRWFYDEAPAIRIDSWGELESVIPALLNDFSLLQAKHEAVLDWWREKCSEQAIGKFIAKRIGRT